MFGPPYTRETQRHSHYYGGVQDNVLCFVYNHADIDHLYRSPPTKLKKNRERELYLVIYSEPIFIK